jgi:hypothetical protein
VATSKRRYVESRVLLRRSSNDLGEHRIEAMGCCCAGKKLMDR